MKRRDQEKKNNDEAIFKKDRKRPYSCTWTARDMSEMYPRHVSLLEDATEQEFDEFLKERRESNRNVEKRKAQEAETAAQFDSFLEDIINALCHPDVINKAAGILLERPSS